MENTSADRKKMMHNREHHLKSEGSKSEFNDKFDRNFDCVSCFGIFVF